MSGLTALEMSLSPTHPVEHATFIVQAILFDMDGTLVDSIAAVEAAWSSVAHELSMDAETVIAATHGRRAIDNLKELKPKLRRLTNEQMEVHVEDFEKRILREADEFGNIVRSRRSSGASSRRPSQSVSRRGSNSGNNPLLPALGGLNFGMSKIATPETESPSHEGGAKESVSTNLETLTEKLARLATHNDESNSTKPLDRLSNLTSPFDDSDSEEDEEDEAIDLGDYTEEEIGCQNKSVRILPGVRRLIDSLPKGRFAVATSGAKTYCHGALLRAGIQRPTVTITADDPRLKRGKPFPDPFLLAAKELGYAIEDCLVFEDSPSGIKAGVVSGAKTIAVCTSHPVEKINDCGAHYVVPSLDCVHAYPQADGSIKIVIDAHPPTHANHGKAGSFVAVAPIDKLLAKFAKQSDSR